MMAAVLVWFAFCGIYLGQALFRESDVWAHIKQCFALWRQIRHDLRHSTPAPRTHRRKK
jgi:hypothetical protein